MHTIVLFSGGLGSYEVAKRLVRQHKVSNVTLLFTDTLVEDSDSYRFIVESVHYLSGSPGMPEDIREMSRNVPDIRGHEDVEGRRQHLKKLASRVAECYPLLAWVIQGMTPWEVALKERMIPNTQNNICSRVLKIEPGRAFVNQHSPEDTQVAIGIDWTEIHRYDSAAPRWLPYTLIAPLVEDFSWSKADTLMDLKLVGIEPPRAYSLGMPHNNCLAQGCLKGGLAYWKDLERVYPSAYDYSERAELDWQAMTGKPNTALKLQRRSGDLPLSLEALRSYIPRGYQEKTDIGGCGCMLDP